MKTQCIITAVAVQRPSSIRHRGARSKPAQVTYTPTINRGRHIVEQTFVGSALTIHLLSLCYLIM